MTTKRTGGFLLSFLIGSAVGSAIALMYAPKSGRHLRNDISRKTGELIDQGKKLTYDSWNGAKETAETTFESANEFLNTGVDKIVNKAERVKDSFKTGIEAFKEERRSGKDLHSLAKKESDQTY
ncbi:MAG: YtxH domain-containing protein [Ignavibacteria bacterium]|nr:YtxH domain-containing protein [Ignavibacteria bacterium]